MLDAFVTGMLVTVSAICIYTDLRWGRIYNVVLGPALVAGLGYHLYTGGAAGFLFALKGFGLGLVLLLLPFALGGVGGGDVKFLAAVGALGGPAFVFKVFLCGALIGGVMALVTLVRSGELRGVLRKLGRMLYARLLCLPAAETLGTLEEVGGSRLPYGVAFGLGVLAVLFFSARF